MADKDNQTHADMSSEGDGELAAIRAILADAEAELPRTSGAGWRYTSSVPWLTVS